jgi:hypothetical protein
MRERILLILEAIPCIRVALRESLRSKAVRSRRIHLHVRELRVVVTHRLLI